MPQFFHYLYRCVQGEQDETYGAQFAYSAHKDEIILAGVFVRIYNEQVSLGVSAVGFVCDFRPLLLALLEDLVLRSTIRCSLNLVRSVFVTCSQPTRCETPSSSCAHSSTSLARRLKYVSLSWRNYSSFGRSFKLDICQSRQHMHVASISTVPCLCRCKRSPQD